MSKDSFVFPFILIILLSVSLILFALIIADDREKIPGRVLIYSHNGTLLKEYTGKIGNIWRHNGFKFTVDGRRINTQGCTVIFEEEASTKEAK